MKQVTATAAETIPGVITAGNLYDGVFVTVHQRTLENPTPQTEECLVIIGEDFGYHCVNAEFISHVGPRITDADMPKEDETELKEEPLQVPQETI